MNPRKYTTMNKVCFMDMVMNIKNEKANTNDGKCNTRGYPHETSGMNFQKSTPDSTTIFVN